MQHKQIIKNLQHLTNKKITQQEIADILCVSINTIGARATRNSSYSVEEIIKIGNYYGVDLFHNDKNTVDNSEIIAANYYGEMNEYKNDNELINVKKIIYIPKNIINSYSDNKKYIVISAVGDSMLPKIQDKDKLIIELQDINANKISDNRIYFFNYENKYAVKRLILNVNQLVIKSDNNSSVYHSITLPNKDMDKMKIIGRIRGLIRELD